MPRTCASGRLSPWRRRATPVPGSRPAGAWLPAAWLAGEWLLARVTSPEPPPAVPARDRAPVISVLIPARNEAMAIPGLLASLRAQTHPAAEILVIDDASEDGTGALAAAGGARVLRTAGPPAGWSGKCWALHSGQATAVGDLLVFLDADVTLAPDALARLAAAHSRVGAGVVSAEPHHRPVLPYEHLSAVANLVVLMGTGAFARATRRAPAMAFGPCLVIDRDTYDLVGGHAHPHVRSKITEDLAIARRVRAAGRGVTVLAGGDTVTFRMYPGGARQLYDGWTKVLATGAAAAPPVASLGAAAWVTGALVAAGRGARAAGDLATGRVGRRTAADALTYLAWALQVRRQGRKAGRFAWWSAAGFPLPLLTFVACAVRSAVKIGLGRELAWRGRQLTGR